LLNLDLTGPIDLEQLLPILLPIIYESVGWAYLRYRRNICQDELDDLSQQIAITLIEDNCARLRSFKCHSSVKTWLQVIANHYVYDYFHRRKHTESLDEADQGSLTYSPPQDRDIYIEEKQRLLSRALGNLNDEELLLYQLWFVIELDAKKIADVLGTEEKIIYKRKQTLVLKLTRLVRNFQSH